MKEETIKGIKKILKNSGENQILNLTPGCFLDNNCDITRCKSKDYVSEDIASRLGINHPRKGKCCPHYEYKCRFILEPLLENNNQRYF
jgi:hypothetical protein